MATRYFLLLVQEKVPKEKDTPRLALRVPCVPHRSRGSSEGISLSLAAGATSLWRPFRPCPVSVPVLGCVGGGKGRPPLTPSDPLSIAIPRGKGLQGVGRDADPLPSGHGCHVGRAPSGMRSAKYPRSGRSRGVSFSLGTFSWTRKRKYLVAIAPE